MNKTILSLPILLAFIISSSAQNTVSFDNQSGETALVKLIGPTTSDVEVPDSSKQSVQALAGKYFIKVRYGVQGKYHFTKGQEFTVDQTPTTTSEITITLHKVVAGNYESGPISEDEFNKDALSQKRETATTLTAEPSTRKEFAPVSRPSGWGMKSRLGTRQAQASYNAKGILDSIHGVLTFVIVFEKPPCAVVATEQNASYLHLPFAPEKRMTIGKTVIVTPEVSGWDFQIPFCSVTTQGFDSPKLSLLISKFADYSDALEFNMQVEASPTERQQLQVDDIDCFSDGSEHHIYGHVKLFGATITNTEKEPLIFRLSGDRYEYVSGKGTATTADGQTLKFGN
jgi:hypothetical protein